MPINEFDIAFDELIERENFRDEALRVLKLAFLAGAQAALKSLREERERERERERA